MPVEPGFHLHGFNPLWFQRLAVPLSIVFVYERCDQVGLNLNLGLNPAGFSAFNLH